MNYPTFTVVALLCGFFVYINCQEIVPSLNEVKDKLNGIMDGNGTIPGLEEANNLFKKKCQENGGPGAYERATVAKDEMEQCIKSLVNMTQLQAEMEKYKPTGDLDLVFKDYCKKRPILKKCVANFTSSIEPCLEPRERESKNFILNITESLLNFACFKEGDRIALFISAGGPECFESKQQEIQDCLNSTFGSYAPKVDPNNGASLGLESLPSLVLGDKECHDIERLRVCVAKELEKCPDATPANIVDSVFIYILKETPCKKILYPEATTSPNSAHAHHINAINLISLTSILFLSSKLV